MSLKNYTSSISADITVARIERLLVDAGATGIAKEYSAGKVVALIFRLKMLEGKPEATIKLPARLAECTEEFWKDHCRGRVNRSRKVKSDFIDQAERTAWKLQQDWVEVQVSLIKFNQQEPMQAFLAYAWDGQSTVYERVKLNGFRAMLPEKSES